MSTNQKIQHAVELQIKANNQIDTYGEASADVVNELMFLVDSLTDDEYDEFIDQMAIQSEDEVGGGMRHCGTSYYEG